jgi:hypothetical protein
MTYEHSHVTIFFAFDICESPGNGQCSAAECCLQWIHPRVRKEHKYTTNSPVLSRNEINKLKFLILNSIFIKKAKIVAGSYGQSYGNISLGSSPTKHFVNEISQHVQMGILLNLSGCLF